MRGVVRPAKQERSRDKRDRLFSAAQELFATVGYEQTKIADIADAAGMSVGVFYQRFKNKRALFDALEVEFNLEAKKARDAYYEQLKPNCSALQFLDGFVATYVAFMSKNVGFLRAMVTLGHHNKDVLDHILIGDFQAAEQLEDYLVKRKFLSRRKLRDKQVYASYTSMTKTLLVTALNDYGPFRVTDKKFIKELAHMMHAHLGLSAD